MLHAIAEALDISAETLLLQAGLVREHAGRSPAEAAGSGESSTERAIRADLRLSDAQKEALISVYRSYTAGTGGTL